MDDVSPLSEVRSISAGSLSTIQVSGEVGPGVVRARITGAAHTMPGVSPATIVGEFQGFAQVASSEEMRLTIPGVAPGTFATIRYSYFVPGNVSIATSGTGAAISRVYFAAGSGHWSQGISCVDDIGGYVIDRSIYPGGVVGTPDSDNFPTDRILTYERRVEVGAVFGVSQVLQLQLQGLTDFGGGGQLEYLSGSVQGEIDFGNSAYWNGVSVVTIDGIPIADFTLLNSSGIDFSGSFAPVPEPETYAVIAASALLLGAIGHRLRNPRS